MGQFSVTIYGHTGSVLSDNQQPYARNAKMHSDDQVAKIAASMAKFGSRGQHTVVAAALRQAFDQPDPTSAGEIWRKVAGPLRSRWPKLADLMDDSEHDVLAYMTLPGQHRKKLHPTNPIERLDKEVERRADVVGIFPSKGSATRRIGAVLFEQNDEWQTASRYMQVEAFAHIDQEETDPILSMKAA